MQPDVSVVIPTYNRRGFLESAIQSCFAGNDALDVEVVVVDDGSSDGTREYLERLDYDHVRPFLQEHQGAQVARNRGLSEANGEYVKFVDDDDVLVGGSIRREVELISRDGADVSYGNLIVADGPGERSIVKNQSDEDLACGIFEGGIKTIPPVFMYCRNFLTDLEWDPDQPYYQDAAFALSVASKDPQCVKVEHPVAVYHRHDGERITTKREDTPILENYQRQAQLIWKGIEQLQSRGNLRGAHRRAAARGLWQWMHMMAPLSFEAFSHWYARLRKIHPGFRPSRSHYLLEMLDRVGTPVLTETLLQPLRKLCLQWRSLRRT